MTRSDAVCFSRRASSQGPRLALAVVTSLAAHAGLLGLAPRVHIARTVSFDRPRAALTVHPTVPVPPPAAGLPTTAEPLAPVDPTRLAPRPSWSAGEVAEVLQEFGLVPPPDPLALLEQRLEPAAPSPVAQAPAFLPAPEVIALPERLLPEGVSPPATRPVMLPREESISASLSPAAASGGLPQAAATLAAAGLGAGAGAGRAEESADLLASLAMAPLALPPAGLPTERAPVSLPVLPGSGGAADIPLPQATAQTGPLPRPIDRFVDVRLTAFGAGDGFHYFQLWILNPPERPLPPFSRDIIFVIDSSKSMGDAKVAAARDAVLQEVRQLEAGARWNVVQFKATPLFFSPELCPAGDPGSLGLLSSYLQELGASGQTDVFSSLHSVVRSIGGPAARPVQVCLISDGRPTTGLRDSRQIIDLVSRENRAQASVFSVGAGGRVDRDLLSYLAYWNRGQARIVDGVREIGPSLGEIVAAHRRPVLCRPRCQILGADRGSVLPSALPDLYEGVPLVLRGRVPSARHRFAIHVLGEGRDGARDMVLPQDLTQAAPATSALAREWAEAYLFDLRGRLARGEDAGRTRDEMTRVAQAFRIPLPD